MGATGGLPASAVEAAATATGGRVASGTRTRTLIICFAACLGTAALAATPWQTDLFLPGRDTWHARVAISLTNPPDGPAQGYPTELSIGDAAGQVPIQGVDARAVRVCEADGTELLFDLRGPDGQRVDDGPVPAGSRLIVPCTALPGAGATLFVYWDNPQAYLLPDWLDSRGAPSNLDFEAGQGTAPDGWRFSSVDASHRLSWSAERPHGGRRCVQAQVDPGAEASWLTCDQSDLSVLPGRHYRVTAWVRGEDVVGRAGWFVHVATAAEAQAVNEVVPAGDGTFDWRQVTIDFTVPPGAVSLRHGTILHGTGTAWFDDVSVSCLDDAAGQPRAAAGAVERLELRQLGGDAPFLRQDGRAWELRLPATVINPGEAMPAALVSVPANAVLGRLREGFNPASLRVVDPAGQVLPHLVLGDELLFMADLPAHCLATFQLQFSRARSIPPGPMLRYEDLVDGPGNLAANPSFEQGDALPTGWSPMVENEPAPSARMERVEGGPVGGHCVRLTVAPDAPRHWTGWSQSQSVSPGCDYLFLASLRTKGITDGPVRIHAHLFEGDGPNAPRRFWSGGPDVQGDRGWTRVGGRLHTTARTTRLTLFLTMNCRGTVEHDGVVFRRTVTAAVGEIEELPQPDAPLLAVWAVDPIVKVFRDTPASPAPVRLDLHSGRNEEECLQLCLRSTRDLKGVRLEVDPPTANGAGLPAPRVEQVGYVPCLEPSGFRSLNDVPPWQRWKTGAGERSDGWRGWWPDYLTPVGGAIDLTAGRTQPLWVTFRVPRDASPGEYRTRLQVQAGGTTVEIPLTLQVWSLVLPDRPSLQALIDLRQGPGWNLFDTPERREQWWRFMARHRLSTDHVLPDPAFRLVDGHVEMEASAFDREAALLFDELHLAAGYFPQIFYACGWGHPPRPFLGLDFGTTAYRQAYQEAVGLFWSHVKERGWSDRLSLYVSDEPHYDEPGVVENLAEVIQLTREVDPAIPVYSSTWGHVPAWDGLLNHWGIAQYGRFPVEVMKQRREAGDKLWLTVDGQLVLDTPYNAYERMLPYYCSAYDLSGYEFWALCWYTYDPLKFGWNSYLFHSFAPGKTNFTRYPNGSGHLAYGGELLGFDGPVSTIRLEQMREGLEDYEIFAALRQAGADRPEVEALFRRVRELVPIPNAGGYRSTEILPDPAALTRLRVEAGELLERLTRR